MAKTTEELLEQIQSASSVTDFIADSGCGEPNLTAYLAKLLKVKRLSKSQVIHAGDFNETFGYQIFSGDRKVSRDNALRLALALTCSVEEAQYLLFHAGHAGLYAKSRRDAIIIFALSQGWTLHETNENLFAFGEDILETSRER